MRKKKKVVIIDYQLGNLFSVKQACDNVGIDSIISSNKSDITNADALILPGVGAFTAAMNNLTQLDLIDPIKSSVETGKPILGVCLGLQLLFSDSDEFGQTSGLGILSGSVKKFSREDVKVPQIGWNQIYKSSQTWQNTPLMEVNEFAFMYFVHSYYVDPQFSEDILTKTNYSGIEYCSSVMHDNVFAMQFHPEKSAKDGIGIYKNWATINKLM